MQCRKPAHSECFTRYLLFIYKLKSLQATVTTSCNHYRLQSLQATITTGYNHYKLQSLQATSVAYSSYVFTRVQLPIDCVSASCRQHQSAKEVKVVIVLDGDKRQTRQSIHSVLRLCTRDGELKPEYLSYLKCTVISQIHLDPCTALVRCECDGCVHRPIVVVCYKE